MPHLSQHFHCLRKLRNRIHHRLHLHSTRELNQSTNDGILITNKVEDEEEMLDWFWFFRYILTKAKRFLFRRSYQKCPFDQFPEDLGYNDYVDNLLSPDSHEGFLNANEFLEKYRMSRENFNELVSLIQNHTVFQQTNARGRRQAPAPAHQLMVLLRYLASEGNGATNPNLRNTFKIGRGTSELYKNRCVAAICSLKDQFYFWPNKEERLLIAKHIERKYLFPNCVGMVDGTVNGLAFHLECEHVSNYHGRKLPYSIITTIVCDYKRRIRYYLAGWPGSTHTYLTGYSFHNSRTLL